MKKLNSYIKNCLTSLLLIVGIFTGMQHAQAQQYPVQGFLSIIPPYPAQLADYANPNINRLNLTLTLNDISVNNKRVRLKVFVLRQNSLFTQTSGNYFGDMPVILTSGIPEQLTSNELAGYFKLQNLQGIVPDSYAQPLGEGFMNIYFVVYDYFTGRQLSNKIEFPFFILLNDPPLLNLPLNGAHISNAGAIAPQIAFSWTSRATQASNTDYVFTLSPIYDPSGDPFTQFLASIPLYQTTISNQTNLLYGFAEPPLLPGKTYGWRVQAKAKSGFEDVGLYKQNGFSEIHTFTYDNPCLPIADQDVTVEARASDRLYVQWQPPTDAGQQLAGGYMVAYRKYSAGGMWNWQEQSTQNPNYYITGLEPTTDYEVKVARTCTDGTYTYTNPQKATTLAVNQLPVKIDCGKIPSIDISNQNPLPQLNSGDVVMAGDFPVTILRANSAAGRFSGEGWVKVPYLADTKIHVTYQNIKVNTEYKLIDGYFETVYNAKGGNIASVDETLADIKATFDRLIKAIQNYDGSVKAKADATEADSTLKANNIIIQNSPFLTDAEKQAVQESITKAQPCLDALKKGDTCPDNTPGTAPKYGPSVEIIINASQYDCWKPAAIAALGNTQSPVLKNNTWIADADNAVKRGLYFINEDPKATAVGTVTSPDLGISPDGEILSSVSAVNVSGSISAVISIDEPYFIIGFHFNNSADGSVIKEYLWSADKKGYYNGDDQLNVNRPPNNAPSRQVYIYEVLTEGCYYHRQLINWQYNPNIDVISLPNNLATISKQGTWSANTLFSKHKTYCQNNFVDPGNSKVADCTTPETILAATNALIAMIGSQEPDNKPLQNTDHNKLADLINGTCKNGLLGLLYPQLIKLFVTLASDETISDDEERAILLLMSAIKTPDYLTFFDLLEANNNALLINLVNGMGDATLPWQGNNYSNYIRALVTMFNAIPSIISTKIDPTLLKNVVDLEGVNYKPINTDDPSFAIPITVDKYNSSSYNSETGEVTINEVYATNTSTGYAGIGTVTDNETISIATVSPLTPILLHFDRNVVPLIDLAIDGITPDKGDNYLVPAIFLKYTADKVRNNDIKTSTMLVLDAATIVGSGGTALAADVLLARRLWALTEVAGAVGNIGVNTSIIKEGTTAYNIVQAYNAAMGIVGIGHATYGAVNFLKNLPDATKAALNAKQSLRSLVAGAYLKYNVAVTNLGELSNDDKLLVAKQEQVFKALGAVKETATNLKNWIWIATNDITKLRLPQTFIHALKTFGKTEDDILSYFTKYHNERSANKWLNDIEYYITNKNLHNLTREEVFALWGYTTNYFYRDLNNYLRNGTNITQTQELTDLLNSALNKLPNYSGRYVYRGITISANEIDNFIAGYDVESIHPWSDFTSCGGSINSSFGERNEVNVIFQIEHKTGKDISDLADGIYYKIPAMEKPEILINSNEQFKVVNKPIFNNGLQKWIIQLQQLN